MSIAQHETMRVHIFGASGSGTTTLGRALASHWSIPHHDTDDYYWMPTATPFQSKRPVHERLALMERMFLGRPKWILSGSIVSWSETLIPYFDVLVFLDLDNDTRMERLQAREEIRYGREAVKPAGERHQAHVDFMQWNAGYEKNEFEGRSRKTHEAWINLFSVPVLRLNSSNPVDDVVGKIDDMVFSLRESG